MRPEGLTNTEKRDQLHSLIPADVFKIDNLNKATPKQLAQLGAGLEIAQALEQMPQNFATNGIASTANTSAKSSRNRLHSATVRRTLLVSRMGSPVFSPLP
jgi:hypothetical protein